MSSIMYKTRTSQGWKAIVDPTVPEWAKQSTKPTYTASEVGALTSEDLTEQTFEIPDLQVETITVKGVSLEDTVKNCAEQVILGGEW